MLFRSAALADEPAAASDNPAGIVAPTLPSVTLGFDYLGYDFSIDDDSASPDDLASVVFGTTFPIPLERVIGIRAAFGLALQMSADILLEQSVPFPTVPQFVLHQNTAVTGLRAVARYRARGGRAVVRQHDRLARARPGRPR